MAPKKAAAAPKDKKGGKDEKPVEVENTAKPTGGASADFEAGVMFNK